MTVKKRGEMSLKKKKYAFTNKKIIKFDVQWMKKLTSKEAKKQKKTNKQRNKQASKQTN